MSTIPPCPEQRIAELDAEQLEHLRMMSLDERARLLAMACQAAARMEQSRVTSGMPRSISMPWPESTWEFLKKCARNERE